MTNELIVRVERPVLPAPVWNRDETQSYINETLARYTGRVYTPESIKDAKTDRAEVNRLDKQLGDAARGVKKFYEAAYSEFAASIKEMQAQCKTVSGAIDTQVKAVEQAEKEEKTASLKLVYQDCIGELEPLIPFERLLDSHLLNKTYDLAQASRELRKAVEKRREELKIIRNTCGEDAEGCVTEYLRNLSINDAMHELDRRKKSREDQRQAEAARKAAERVRASAPIVVPPSEEERQIIAEARQEAHASTFITASGRLDCEVLQQFAAPAPQPRKRYSFWVDFTPEDIAWFKAEAKKRGFQYGSIK